MHAAFILFLVFSIGYLAQSIGLCMVKGVKNALDGKPEFLISILLSGTFTWVAIMYSLFRDLSFSLSTYSVTHWFLFGGLLFGLGAAFNQGCGVSTIGRLCRGEYQMIFTVFGWLAGWTILAVWSPNVERQNTSISPLFVKLILMILSSVIFIWLLKINDERKKLWLKMMSIGLIGGFVFLHDPSWTPSGLLKKLSMVIAYPESYSWPTISSYIVVLSLLLGMFAAAWKMRTFKLVHSTWRHWLNHLLAGTLMGIGSSLAIGGNDTQLLLALPALSPARLTLIVGMLIGIWVGLNIRNKPRIYNN